MALVAASLDRLEETNRTVVWCLRRNSLMEAAPTGHRLTLAKEDTIYAHKLHDSSSQRGENS